MFCGGNFKKEMFECFLPKCHQRHLEYKEHGTSSKDGCCETNQPRPYLQVTLLIGYVSLEKSQSSNNTEVLLGHQVWGGKSTTNASVTVQCIVK